MSGRLRRAAAIAVMMACGPVATPSAVAEGVTLEIPAEPPGGPLRRRVQRALPAHVGCAVLVIGRDAAGEPIDFRAGYGRCALAEDSPRVTAGTNFRVGSFSKVLTALAILRMADAGELSLDDPVSRWLVGMPDWAQRCTLRSMLNHTSGVEAYHQLLGWVRVVGPLPFDRRHSDLNVFHAVATSPPRFAAGASTDYSNSAYVLLGLVAQQAAGVPMHVALRKWALRPAGMNRSEVLVPALNAVQDRAYGHKPGALNQRDAAMLQSVQRQLAQFRQLLDQPNLPVAQADAFVRQVERLEAQAERLTPPPELASADWHQEDQSEYSELGGDGALYTSIEDLAALVDAVFQRGPILSEGSWALWTAPQTDPPPGDRFGDAAAERRFACGWMIDERTGEPRLSHRGQTRGFRQTVQVFPASRRAVAVLMNSTPVDPETGAEWDDRRLERLGEHLLRVVLGKVDDDTEADTDPGEVDDTFEPIELRRDRPR